MKEMDNINMDLGLSRSAAEGNDSGSCPVARLGVGDVDI
jgi:hypothetical protein